MRRELRVVRYGLAAVGALLVLFVFVSRLVERWFEVPVTLPVAIVVGVFGFGLLLMLRYRLGSE